MNSLRRYLPAVGLTVAIVAAIIIYAVFDPTEVKFFPRCPFKMLTGLDCPGCGSQRAIHALLHGDIATAIHYNILVIPAFGFIVALLVAEWGKNRSPRLNRLRDRLNSPAVIWTIFAIVIAWWLLRNIFWRV